MSTGRGRYLSGVAAEEIAARLYRDAGAEVLATRWRAPEGEIDLIVRAGAVTVFVEVKARSGRGGAAHALTPAQTRRLGAAASRWLAERGGAECRFDVVLIDGAGRAERLENAIQFDV